MCSTAAASATAIQVISVQELFYNNNLNAGIAIFTLLSSQLIGYGFAGLLLETVVYPSVTFWPGTIVTANMSVIHTTAPYFRWQTTNGISSRFQAFHFDGGLSTKRTKVFWGVFAAMYVFISIRFIHFEFCAYR
jgi:hypothetical protein